MMEKVNWDTAYLRCSLKGANLASVKDGRENSFIEGLISTAPKGWEAAWLGLRDMHKHKGGLLKWKDGSPVYYTNWAPGEPNNDYIPVVGRREDCAAMYSENYRYWFFCQERKRGKWNDFQCDFRCPYVCKRPI
ncbi:PREDICTED: ladderlectin-like [Branchiostoma belcheri]|uniref:Ladderlectin-like n=1 Tax=Branchiostoma belcheri TaxID=7741 RepID=A0A6P4XVF5_BRABE|nr:PREDICTED: ladderlectin-like [Branchiostoma belcheri]